MKTSQNDSRKRVKPAFEIFNDEVQIQSIPSETTSLTRKLVIDDEEKSLVGAPESDIYDLKLLTDNELKLTNRNIEENKIISRYHEQYFNDSIVWAEKYSIIEEMRAIMKFSCNKVTSESIFKILEVAVKEMESLRSSSVRNSLFLIDSLVISHHNLLSNSSEVSSKLLLTLLGRISGPKFLSEEVSRVVDTLIRSIEPEIGVDILLPHISHDSKRNSDVAALTLKSFFVILSRISSYQFHMLTEHSGSILVTGLFKTLTHSKSVSAKNHAKQCFQRIEYLYGNSGDFDKLLYTHLSEYQVGEVKAAVQGKASASSLADVENHINRSTSSSIIVKKAEVGGPVRQSLKERMKEFRQGKQETSTAFTDIDIIL